MCASSPPWTSRATAPQETHTISPHMAQVLIPSVYLGFQSGRYGDAYDTAEIHRLYVEGTVAEARRLADARRLTGARSALTSAEAEAERFLLELGSPDGGSPKEPNE